MIIDKRIADRRRITAKMRLETMLIQILALTGGVGIGVILMSSVIVSEKQFWLIVGKFWGWV